MRCLLTKCISFWSCYWVRDFGLCHFFITHYKGASCEGKEVANNARRINLSVECLIWGRIAELACPKRRFHVKEPLSWRAALTRKSGDLARLSFRI